MVIFRFMDLVPLRALREICNELRIFNRYGIDLSEVNWARRFSRFDGQFATSSRKLHLQCFIRGELTIWLFAILICYRIIFHIEFRHRS